MVKTRKQVLYLKTKTEESEDKANLDISLSSHSTNNSIKKEDATTTKSKANPFQVPSVQVKSENNVDDNSKQLISTSLVASRKIGKRGNCPSPRRYTQDQINKLIECIVNNKMNVLTASKKMGMSAGAAYVYYNRYKDDKQQKIPLVTSRPYKRCTQYSIEQVSSLIHYITRDGMALTSAAIKAGIAYRLAKIYYSKYLEDPNHEIPDPKNDNPHGASRCTIPGVATLISCIVHGEKTLADASIIANMSIDTATKYYKQYLKDPNRNVPVPESNNKGCPGRHTKNLDQVKKFFTYVIVDKMDRRQAAKKASISEISGYRLYTNYIKKPIHIFENTATLYSEEKMKKMIDLIQNDNMSIKLASKNVGLLHKTAVRYYEQYLKDPQHRIPVLKFKHYTREDLKRLIDCIEQEKMSIPAAARKVNMTVDLARKYYMMYQKDPEHKIPQPFIPGHKQKREAFDTYSQMVVEIYKKNPSIVPIHGGQSDLLDTKVKQENFEEKEELKNFI